MPIEWSTFAYQFAQHWLKLATVATIICATSAHAASTTITLGWHGPTDGDSWAGAQQGIAEANAQGKFLGLLYQLQPLEQHSSDAAGASVVIAALPALQVLRLAERDSDRAVINVSANDDELRSACVANLFHTPPSAAMLDDAVRQWRLKHPSAIVDAQAWHRDFKKYAAAQLNKRYAASTGRAMTDAAWAGWAAVKLVADTSASIGAVSPLTLLDALRHDLAFDGQKGSDMSFRNTGQLRQPLLLIENDKIVGEAPVRGVAQTTDLDSLGLADCLK